MMEIPLTNSIKVALVDDWNYDKVAYFKWYLCKNKNHFRIMQADCSPPKYLHHYILPFKEGFEVDHKDENIFNNLEENLRYATKSQNMMNRGSQFNNMSGYKGVSWDLGTQKWRVQIAVNRKRIYIGVYADKKEAALAYNRAAIQHHGEFAYLNKID